MADISSILKIFIDMQFFDSHNTGQKLTKFIHCQSDIITIQSMYLAIFKAVHFISLDGH